MALIRAMFKLEIKKMLKPYPEESKFWVAYFAETLVDLTKPEVRSLIERVVEYYLSYQFSAADFADWEDRILDSDDDPMVPPETRDELRSLYPTALKHRFSGTGHAASIAKPDEFLSIVRDFLKK